MQDEWERGVAEMSGSRFPVDMETVRRFDRPGPRYTSYPTAVEFHEGVGEEAYRQKLAQANEAGETDPLSLYAHLPFCEHRCLFCGCHVVITPHMPVAEKYLGYVKKEIDGVAELLEHRREVVQMHWGGGTPTYFSPTQLSELFGRFTHHFHFAPDAELAIEVDPRVTSKDHLESLVELGFNRLSMGVQDLTPEVQKAITREQSYEQTAELMDYARKVGFTEGINLDLIYGLPKQRMETFETNLDQVLGLRPDRVAVYSFAYVPWIKGHQKKMDQEALPSAELKLQLYLKAMERFLDAGYEPIGMDHFALPEDELAVAAREGRLSRNFMGYTVMPASDMVAVGVSGIGEVQGAFFQNRKKLSTYYESLDAGRLPVEKGYVLSEDDRIRQYVIKQIMCNFRIGKADVSQRFNVDFDEYFRRALESLQEVKDAGVIELNEDGLRVREEGRLFVRNVCMAFDRYLEEKTGGGPVFSRTV
jgi:oxygen-independent coproporphyrinogen-3 oxidase